MTLSLAPSDALHPCFASEIPWSLLSLPDAVILEQIARGNRTDGCTMPDILSTVCNQEVSSCLVRGFVVDGERVESAFILRLPLCRRAGGWILRGNTIEFI